ncbi:MAG: 2-C-methyl-D-erythritol 4-phosphate cytidylyltransferase [Deltaproteobacteria bacterium]|nr:2-C-methyl-D-erythritol 4-phosphate cytidylyltransferase [Deltaproteobacteria bacterium]MCL5791493.1 2-C-methyl-D-erythritol 4-phosphate cytidylyltransferase [Deltaproteobacteria bacterium]
MPKQFIDIAGKPLLVYALEIIDNIPLINDIIISSPANNINFIKKLINDFNIKKVSDVVVGGNTRTQSVRNAFNKIKATDYVFIHDAVRPFITTRIITDVINRCLSTGAAICALPVMDTVKLIDGDDIVVKNVDRTNLWVAQTPQMFKYSMLTKAYEYYDQQPYDATDESSIIEQTGTKVSIVRGDIVNIKITTEADLNFAKTIVSMLCIE